MDMPWGSPAARKFVTNVGLITTHGIHGHNIASMEWTHAVSYSPGMIMVNIMPNDATAENIEATKEFGISLAAEDQNVAASVAGGTTGKVTDKIAVLKELGVAFFEAQEIGCLLVKGAALNIECRLVESKMSGTHMMFIGEIVALAIGEKEPLAYHDGKFFRLGERLPKPGKDTIENIAQLIAKHQKK